MAELATGSADCSVWPCSRLHGVSSVNDFGVQLDGRWQWVWQEVVDSRQAVRINEVVMLKQQH